MNNNQFCYTVTLSCQDSFNLLKKYHVKSPVLKNPDPEKPSTFFTDSSKYTWACVLTKAYDHIIEEKQYYIPSPIWVAYLEAVSSIGPLLLKKLMLSICLTRNYHST